ncbi:putative sister chromatid cohesion 1 protein 2 [Cocos nucifera]|nr:putative sister chromatid cohesion 1 protein 2 [Cocos nucifera]
MFYSQSLLSKKGPLGNIWIAAFWFKKLKKDQIADTDISSCVDQIIPEVQISYRVLAQLLLGIVRIFSKKVDYLYHDCNEALTNIRKSFMPSQRTVRNEAIAKPRHNVTPTKKVIHAPDQRVNIAEEAMPTEPIEAMRASHNHVTITVPERFELDSFDLDISDECVLPSHMMDIDFEISEIYNSNSLGVRGEKTWGYSQHIEVSGSFAGLVAMESLGPNVHNVESEHQVHPLKPQKMMPSDPDKNIHAKESLAPVEPTMLHLSSGHENAQVHVREDSKATSPSKTYDRTCLPCDSGLASPKFTVRTPAKKERPLMLRKRKNLLDETIVLSNETLRQGIHDASSLICKRRKAPHTFLDAWKADIIANLQQTFMDPLVPCTSSELKALFQNKPSDYLSAQKTLADYHTESGNAQNGIPNKSADNEETCQERIIETPATERFAEEPGTSKSSEIETNKPSSLETSDTELDWMDRGIHDASSLICKRRKAPHTFLDAWKADIIANLQQTFMDPLVPCTSSELKALFQNKPSDYLSAQKTLADYHTESGNAQNGIPNKSADNEETCQERIIETPATERFAEEPGTSKSSEIETNKPSSLETSDTELDWMDRELGSHEESNIGQDNGWSVRTRAVAQYLCSKLLHIKNQEQKGFLSLARILEGKTRRKCARFFYETLKIFIFFSNSDSLLVAELLPNGKLVNLVIISCRSGKILSNLTDQLVYHRKKKRSTQ